MTYREDFPLPAELLERVSKQGFDILPELIQVIINAAMQVERQQYLKAEPYQHSEEREGHANGYKPKTVHTRVGNIAFSIPQVREGGFYPEALEKGLRSERALLLVAGSADHLIPPSLTRTNYARYGRSPAVTGFKEFPGRTHFIVGQKGWEEVAGYALSWLEEQDV